MTQKEVVFYLILGCCFSGAAFVLSCDNRLLGLIAVVIGTIALRAIIERIK